MSTKPKNYCCEFMEQQLSHTCDQHGDNGKCPNVLVERARFKFGEGKLILLARNAEYACNFCPSCSRRCSDYLF